MPKNKSPRIAILEDSGFELKTTDRSANVKYKGGLVYDHDIRSDEMKIIMDFIERVRQANQQSHNKEHEVEAVEVLIRYAKQANIPINKSKVLNISPNLEAQFSFDDNLYLDNVELILNIKDKKEHVCLNKEQLLKLSFMLTTSLETLE